MYPAQMPLMGFAEFTIGPAKGRTRWLNPSYNPHCPTKMAFGIMPWMPFVPSTTWVTW
jgi:hypothetical protein